MCIRDSFFGTTARTKFALQKDALLDVILSLKGTEFPRNVGVRIFGSAKPVSENDCSDTTLLYPVSEPNLDRLKEVLADLIPQGESPLGASLSAAAQDFPPMTGVDQMIVLITDGVDTCDADPCQIARDIHIKNPQTSIQVIGFDLSQSDAEKVRCIADESDGKFYLARNEEELRKSLDEAINSKIPYNLRLATTVGATPIPVSITIYKSGTNKIIKSDTSFGTKLISLPSGTYDILVEYTASPEFKKPSKMIKGVEILERTKVEQKINFDFGRVTLSATDAEGQLTKARYEIRPTGKAEAVAEMRTFDQAQSVFLPPGTYDITVEQEGILPERIRLTEKGVEVKSGEPLSLDFLFQEGTLNLKGLTTQKEPIPFIYQIFKSETPEQIYASGAFEKDGGEVTLSPGQYDIIFIGQDPAMSVSPRSKATNIPVRASETSEVMATFEMGTLVLKALNGADKPVPAEFDIRSLPSGESLLKIQTPKGEESLTVPIPPGKYEILASKIISTTPKPTTLIPNVEVSATQPVERTVRFDYGTLRVRGRNAKEQPIKTSFDVYRSGIDESFGIAEPSNEWTIFELPAGLYDIRAINVESESKVEAPIWMKDIEVKTGQQVSLETIFTAGKLKIIGRGANNVIIDCQFKVFEYGSDRELIKGETGDDWQIFEIQPGSYYLEAGYVDPEASVLLKKWINIKVAENEILEVILYF
jgi:hypothetical protein